ncbi:hypothetical protein Syun_024295 [Stephania yunnanensis]|uniref:Uncharacterized protein n=1 Tax=Stephania yunnanensis TaxID=152371 RepID=A0AAP0I463_9MAGN
MPTLTDAHFEQFVCSSLVLPQNRHKVFCQRMASTGRGGGGGAAIAAAATEELRAMANGGHHKKVLITSVGRGLGRALAIEMARRGHTVFGFSRDFYDLESLGLIIFSDPDHCHVLFHLAVHDDEIVSLFAHNAIDLVQSLHERQIPPEFDASDVLLLMQNTRVNSESLHRMTTYKIRSSSEGLQQRQQCERATLISWRFSLKARASRRL